MSLANEPSFLAKLANLFRAEGDTATVDALLARWETTSARSISDEDRHRVLALQRKGSVLTFAQPESKFMNGSVEPVGGPRDK